VTVDRLDRSALLRRCRGLASAGLVLLTLLLTAAPASADQGPEIRILVRIEDGWRQIMNVPYVSQLREPAPPYWNAPATPYCAAAAALGILQFFSVALPAQATLRTLFEQGRAGNTTTDPGLDPDGISFLLRAYGGDGQIHAVRDRRQALSELVGRLNHGSPVIALTQGGGHAVTVYGYDADLGGSVVALHVADPLSGFSGRVSVTAWQTAPLWSGTPFQAPGAKWAGAFVFVAYREFPSVVPAPALTPPVPGTHHSKWVTQAAGPVLSVKNPTGQVTVSLRNSGSLAWVKGTASEIRLGVAADATSYGPSIGAGWPTANRVAAQDQPRVAPGEVATFTITLRAATAGTYKLPLRPVIDGLSWLEDEGIFTVVTVQGP